MAAWGTGLYQDDIAEDVKFDYHNYFKEGLNNQEAYAKLLQSYSDVINDPEDQSVFWFALADTMWNLGKLTNEVKEQALSCIASGRDIERWKEMDEKKAEKRQQVLEKLKEKLESPMPKEKKIGKKRIFKNKWEIGDMYVMPITGTYPRFPEMKVKYLLLIKIGDKKDLSGHIQPVVYIKYLDKEYNKDINIDELVFSPHYDYGYKFVICGIAGRAQPKQLTYVGNYKNVYSLKKPENDKEIEELYCNHECYVKSLEHTCIAGYLMYVLGIDGKKISKTIHMTEQEYNQYCLQVEENRIKNEEKKYQERKKKEYYICPWKDGDVFYLPIREETEDGIELIRRGFVGIVLMKIGIKEDYATTNQWPIVIMQCVKKDYNDVKDVLNEDVFCNKCSYKKHIIIHKKFETIPDEIKWIGNIDDFNNINILEKVQLPFKWSQIEWYLYKILRVC